MITIFSVGLAQGALAIVIQAGVKLGNNIADTILQKVLLVSSAALYFIYNSYYNMIILMILSGIVSLLFVLFFEFKELFHQLVEVVRNLAMAEHKHNSLGLVVNEFIHVDFVPDDSVLLCQVKE